MKLGFIEDYEKSIPSKIKQLRVKKQLSQRSLGKLLNTTQQEIARYEVGDRIPTHPFWMKLAKKYKLNLNWVYMDDGPMFLEKVVSEPEIKGQLEIYDAMKEQDERSDEEEFFDYYK